jgi:hypothetical protein
LRTRIVTEPSVAPERGAGTPSPAGRPAAGVVARNSFTDPRTALPGTGSDGKEYIVSASARGGIVEDKTECGLELIRKEKGAYEVLDSTDTIIRSSHPDAV